MPNPTDFFLEVTQALLAEPGVHRGTMMGLPCLRVDGTFFASSDTGSGGLIVKLPADRVEMMVASGAGRHFAPNGRTFREWVLIDDRCEHRWVSLLHEALDFGRSH